MAEGQSDQLTTVRVGGVVIPLVRIARGPLERARGLLGHPPPPPGEALALRPCRAVHTFGMRFLIDVIFFDREDRIVRIVRNLRPGRIAFGGRSAVGAIEATAGWMAPPSLSTGLRLTWAASPATARSTESLPPRS
ncbi:MAG: DUF192 domain-containing protein [Kiritimatiellae bacterium]|nr:DUF192 domain-containing protein [Kiritimatiellia bacterium]